MLVHLDVQIRLVAHLLREQVGHHRVRAAAVVGEVHREQARVAAHELRARQQMLPERPVHARMVGRDVQIVRVQVRHRDYLLPAVDQRVGDVHVQRGIGRVVLPRDQHQHALARRERAQQLLAQRLGLARELLHREPAGHHGSRAFLGRVPQLRAHAQQRLGQRLLPEVHVHKRAHKRDAALLQPQRPRHHARRHLHVRARVVVRHLRAHVPDGVHRRLEDVVHAPPRQLLHVPVHQLHGVAHLALRLLLREPHRVLGAGVGEHHVVAQLAEERVRQRKQLVQHEAARDAHRLFPGVDGRVVPFEVQRGAFAEERAVRGHLLAADRAAHSRGALQRETAERRALRQPARMQQLARQQRRAHRARHGEPRRHGERLAVELPKRRHDGRVVRHATLQNHAPPHGLAAHHLVQVVAHDGKSQPRGDVGTRCPLRQRGVDSRLHEHRAALAQIDGRLCGKRQRAVLAKRDAEARGLLLHERAGARRAHLVHLEVGHLPVRQRDVLGILPADLEHRVRQRVGRHGGARLRGDLVAHGIGADQLPDERAARPRDAHSRHAHLGPEALPQRGQPLAHRLLRVAARAQVLRVQQPALFVQKHEVGGGGAHVHAQNAGGEAVRVRGPRARQRAEARPRIERRGWKRVEARQVALRRGRAQGRAQIVEQRTAARLPGAGRVPCGRSRARGLREQALLARHQLALAQLEHLAHGAHHPGVQQRAAGEQHGSVHRKPADDGGLEALHHGEAQPQQDVLHRHALLLAVDDVGFREHRAAARQARHALRAPHQRRVLLQGQSQPPHLVLEERAGARRAALVHGEPRRRAVGEAGHEERVLRAEAHDGARLGGQQRRAAGEGGHVLQHGGLREALAHQSRAAAREHEAGAPLGRQRRRQRGHPLAQARRDVALVRPPPRPRQLAALGERRQLHRCRARLYAHRVPVRHFAPLSRLAPSHAYAHVRTQPAARGSPARPRGPRLAHNPWPARSPHTRAARNPRAVRAPPRATFRHCA